MIYVFLYIMFVHFVADFICQSDWMARNKSKRLDALSLHVLVYSQVLLFFIALPLAFYYTTAIGVIFVVVNGVLHFTTDFVTSRVSSHFYQKQEWHNFFVVIGFDQFIHTVCLGLTAHYMGIL